MANSTLIDAKGAIQARGLYRQQVKQWLRQAQKGYEDVEREFYADMDKDLHDAFQDFMDLREENLRSLIKSPDPLKIDRNKPIPLFEAIKAALANQGEDDIVFKATIELANAMNDAALATFNAFVNTMRDTYGIDVSRALDIANSHKQKKFFENVCEAVCKYKHGYGFYNDTFVKRALDAVSYACLDCKQAEADLETAVNANEPARKLNEKNLYYHDLADELTEAHDAGLVADIVVKAEAYDTAISLGECNVSITQRQFQYIKRKPYAFARVRRGVSGERTLFRIGNARQKSDGYKLKLQERIAV